MVSNCTASKQNNLQVCLSTKQTIPKSEHYYRKDISNHYCDSSYQVVFQLSPTYLHITLWYVLICFLSERLSF